MFQHFFNDSCVPSVRRCAALRWHRRRGTKNESPAVIMISAQKQRESLHLRSCQCETQRNDAVPHPGDVRSHTIATSPYSSIFTFPRRSWITPRTPQNLLSVFKHSTPPRFDSVLSLIISITVTPVYPHRKNAQGKSSQSGEKYLQGIHTEPFDIRSRYGSMKLKSSYFYPCLG